MTNAIGTLREAQEELHTRMFHDPTWPAVSENLDAALAKMETLLQVADHCIDIVEGRVARSNESVTNAWHALAAAVRDVKSEND